MEEDIKQAMNWLAGLNIYSEYEATNKELILSTIENLINKCKELEKERDDIYADYQDLGKEKLKLEEENQVVRGANNYWVMKFCEANNKNKEQEKVIELMAEAFKQDDIRSEEEIIEHFRKKAKGE